MSYRCNRSSAEHQGDELITVRIKHALVEHGVLLFCRVVIPNQERSRADRKYAPRSVARPQRVALPRGQRVTPSYPAPTEKDDMSRRNIFSPYHYQDSGHLLRGVEPFSWAFWRALHSGFKRSGSKQQERWQLAYLHSPSALEHLARTVRMALRRPTFAAVSVQSIWIDGTPQVMGFLPCGTPLASCELADLLFIVNQMDPSGVTVKRTGLLIQGKTAKRHNALPSNPSTKKERLLLEGLDRSRPLSVYEVA
ncbi:hypothetical protein FQZ97_465640 [compost metagenome]